MGGRLARGAANGNETIERRLNTARHMDAHVVSPGHRAFIARTTGGRHPSASAELRLQATDSTPESLWRAGGDPRRPVQGRRSVLSRVRFTRRFVGAIADGTALDGIQTEGRSPETMAVRCSARRLCHAAAWHPALAPPPGIANEARKAGSSVRIHSSTADCYTAPGTMFYFPYCYCLNVPCARACGCCPSGNNGFVPTMRAR